MAEIIVERSSGSTDYQSPAAQGTGLAPSRVVIENVQPNVDCGRFPVKRCVGDDVAVSASIFADGHEPLAAVVRFRHQDEAKWREIPMVDIGNDQWTGTFHLEKVGMYRYTVEAWGDHFGFWREGFKKKVLAGGEAETAVDLEIGVQIIREAAGRASGQDGKALQRWIDMLTTPVDEIDARARLGFSDELAELMSRYPDRASAGQFRELEIVVDRERAVFSAWYEMFPRSVTGDPSRHGTLRDCEERLPYISGMGFDIVYLPPIHPIGFAFRKGKNNAPAGKDGAAVGSPWAIGSSMGGHKSVHPDLGTMEDFERLVARAKDHGLEIALDIALQASPDHPYVQEHPEWFRSRPDGTIQYAENPPKKYQDIYPFEFDSSAWRALWEELKSIFSFWAEKGVRVFRVDNPHTKPFAFWEWAIGELKHENPDLIFLAEAFTRPKVMYRLAKLGFTQSYTYFTWRNTKRELTEYVTELTQSPVREFFRPNFWPNTPDILNEYLQDGGPPAFLSRLVLAATLSSSYGIYGPVFELMEATPVASGKEEYLDSEKYEIRSWELNRRESLAPLIRRINQARRDNIALQRNDNLRFHETENEQLLAFTKFTNDRSNNDRSNNDRADNDGADDDRFNCVLVVVNLDYRQRQWGFVTLTLSDLGLDANEPYELYDLLTDDCYVWRGPRNYVELRPEHRNAHIFRITKPRITTPRITT